MSLTLVAVSLTAMAGVGALAVDLGMLYKARADALRAAEAGALAGASVFLDAEPQEATAIARAKEMAQANAILNSLVKEGEVTVTPDMNAEQVGVKVARSGIGTWFARVLDASYAQMEVGDSAAAGAIEASGAACVTPIMLPDAWDEQVEDPDGSNWEEQGEQWNYDPQVDSYGPFDPNTGLGGQTGYGSDFRNGDFGRPITLRPKAPEDPAAGLGDYRLWKHPDEDANLAERTGGCDSNPFSLGEGAEYDILPDTETLPLDELRDRIQADSGQTSWDGQNVVSTAGDWRKSPRVIKVALFDPSEQLAGTVSFNNIVLFLLEGVEDQGPNTISGRLLYYVVGNESESGSDGGALVKHIRLVE